MVQKLFPVKTEFILVKVCFVNFILNWIIAIIKILMIYSAKFFSRSITRIIFSQNGDEIFAL